jgi:radical SAM superfamily enzyme YgiQ (UPF0313 family)
MRVVLISTYELGHQPFGLASPAAWLQAAGATVTCLDLAVQPSRSPLVQEAIASANIVAFYVPMHTATRIATSAIKRVKATNPNAHLCCYGLYAPVNEGFLRRLGVDTILGGEFEQGLVSLYKRLAADQARGQESSQPEPRISLAKQTFLTPDRQELPELSRYARLNLGNGIQRIAGYTEASRGCKHLCRHCPIVPVYGGRFRIVQRDVVLEDIRRQVEAGAQHITFGDPDFFNGPGHAIPLVEALHKQFPDLTYDVTIKIEHLLKHARYLPILRDTGCLFVTSAVEAIDDAILEIFDKRHTKADFIRIVTLFREVGLTLNPTFVAFTPWTSYQGYCDFLTLIAQLDLIEHVSPIQYAIRLLIPAGSKLLELPQIQALVGAFDEAALCYPWSHPDPGVDQLHADVLQVVKASQARHESRQAIFEKVWALAHNMPVATARDHHVFPRTTYRLADRPIPHLSEPWYC